MVADSLEPLPINNIINSNITINRLRAIWPKGYQRGSLRKSFKKSPFW